MNIGFDAKRAFFNHSGLGNYSRLLIQSLIKQYPEQDFTLFSPKAPQNKPDFLTGKNDSIKIAPKGIPGSLWRSQLIKKSLQEEGIDLYHGLSNELPFSLKGTGIKSVVTIHDLIFLRYPSFYPLIDRKIYKFKTKKACQQADQIIAISEQTKRDLNHFIGVPLQKIKVIYQSCLPVFRQPISKSQLDRIKNKYRLPDQFLLTVGTIESRKNIELIVKSLKLLPKEIICFSIGRSTPYQKELESYLREHQIKDRMRFLGQIDNETLAAFYRLATLLVYPSLFEGFGLPIIEALEAGLPVIAAKGSCLEEAGGPDSSYIDPHNTEELAKCIQKLWLNESQRSLMTRKGQEYVQRFKPESIAKEMMNCYLEVLKR